MVDTPWGPSERLRERQLKPGPGLSRDAVEANQRQRLFGAVVACVSERGYAGTRLDDLVELSGVSTASFYRLFPTKDACFLAASEEMLRGLLTAISMDGPGALEVRVRDGLKTFADLVVAHPAAGRMLLIESFAAGAEAAAAVDRAVELLRERTAALAAESPERAELPADVPAAVVGAVQELARDRLRRGRQRDLPELMEAVADVALSYRTPSEPLTFTGRLPRARPESLEAPGAAERAIRALAVVAIERGYPRVTVEEVVKRASMSPTTFYAEFADKDEAMLAAIDSAGAQMAAATLPAFRRSRDWPTAVRTAFTDLLAFLASRPSLARLLFIEAYAAGPEALKRRAEALKPLSYLLVPGRARGGPLHPSAPEVILAAVVASIQQRILGVGAHSLPALTPVLTFLATTPYIGSEAAGEAARGAGRSSRAGPVDAIVASYEDPESAPMLMALDLRAATAEELAEELGMPLVKVEDSLERLLAAKVVEPAVGSVGGKPGARRYRASPWLGVISEAEAAEMSIAQRERTAALVTGNIDADLRRAFDAGTVTLRPEHVLARVALELDSEGWREISDILTAAIDKAIERSRASRARLADSAEKPIRASAALMLFELPPEEPFR
jgi:AcrR family transcriptional regulator